MARQRSSNFSSFEKNLLTEIMEQYGPIIEDKRTDNSTVKMKDTAWQQLANTFNGSTGLKEKSDVSQLKACWKNLKTKAKKDAASVRREMFITGGGPPAKKDGPLSEKINSLIPQQMEPFQNPYDDDGVLDNLISDSPKEDELILILQPTQQKDHLQDSSGSSSLLSSTSSDVIVNSGRRNKRPYVTHQEILVLEKEKLEMEIENAKLQKEVLNLQKEVLLLKKKKMLTCDA